MEHVATRPFWVSPANGRREPSKFAFVFVFPADCRNILGGRALPSSKQACRATEPGNELAPPVDSAGFTDETEARMADAKKESFHPIPFLE